MTRLGKIARLPLAVREELNRRLADGEVGKHLVGWLNALPEVGAVLAAEFAGREINEQNLSDWRQGGFEEWQRHQEAREWTRVLAEEAGELQAESGRMPLADRLAAPVALALGLLLRDANRLDETKKGAMLLEVAQQLAQLRRSNHQAERLRLETERWEEHLQMVRATEQKEAEARVRWARSRKRHYPHLDEDGYPHGSNSLTEAFQDSLATNHRLKAAQGTVHSPEESR